MPVESVELRMPDNNPLVDEDGNELLNEFEYTEEELAEIEKLSKENVDIDSAGNPADLDIEDEFLESLQAPKKEQESVVNTDIQNQPDPQPDPELDPPVNQPDPEPVTLPEVEDFSERITELEEKRTETQGKIDDTLDQIDTLAKQFDEGEIGQGQYESQKLRLQRQLSQFERDQDRLEQNYQEINNQSNLQNQARQELINQQWQKDISTFVSQPENDLFKNNPNLAHEFDRTLTALGQAGHFEGMANQQILATVRATLAIKHPELSNQQAKKPADEDKKQKPNHSNSSVPTSLASIPAIDAPEDTDPFAYIHKLRGVAYEEAISKMTPAQYREFYGDAFSDQ